MTGKNTAQPFPWLVHFYTATGAVLAFAATLAAIDGRFRDAFLYLVIATLVDATDGMLARRAGIPGTTPGFDGARLDDIVDYLTFVFVPALMVWRAGLTPEAWLLPVVGAMLLSSAFGFVSADAKTADQFFTGFPSYWNIVVLYLFVLGLAPHFNAAILVTLSALVFVRIGYVYPTRTRTARSLTLALGGLWSMAILTLILQLPTPSRRLAWMSLVFPVYYTCLSIALHVRRSRRGAA